MDIVLEAIPARKLTQAVCSKYSYGIGKHGTTTYQVAEYRSKGVITTQHTRSADKQFAWINHKPKLELFGQHLWGEGQKQIIITEGEIDCLTWAQTRDLKWPVVAVPGVSSIQMIKDNLQWLSTHEEIVLYFDMDEPGQAFANEVAALLPVGKVSIGSTAPYKDVSHLYVVEGTKVLYDTLWQKKLWHPPQLTTAEEVFNQVVPSRDYLSYEWPGMQALTHGTGAGELVLVVAGTNVGKSLVLKNLCYQSLIKGLQVGFIALEESSRSVQDTLLAMSIGQALHELTPEGRLHARDQAKWFNRITFYTDVGEDLATGVLSQVRYLAKALDTKVIYIDHVSAIFSRMTGDQRVSIDKFMYDLRSLCQELGIVVFAACHLRDPAQGATHNDGGMPTLSQTNGSSSLSRVPDTVLGVQRNVNDSGSRHLTKLFLLKHRFDGMSVGDHVMLVQDKGLLKETNIFTEDDNDTANSGF
jgi:twinkle protein